MSPLIWCSSVRKMKVRKEVILLTVSLLSFSVGILVRIQKLRLYPKATSFINHVHNLTYVEEELNNATVKMNYALLITAIKEKFLRPPSPGSALYKLKDPDLKHTSTHAEAIANMLDFQSNGFFVEARAFDGETWSNTLLLERRLNWEGLLVEPDPTNFAQIIGKNRKAWVSHSCLSIRTYPHMISLRHKNIDFVDVQCLPLYSLLLALNRTVVDYLSLSEIDVLEAIPFGQVDIWNLSVDLYEQKGKRRLLSYMKRWGYYLRGTMVRPEKLSVLFMFYKPKPPRRI